jgi:hypothetical protein
MDLTMEWYFTAGTLVFCAVTLAMRAGTLAQRLWTDRRSQTRRTAAPGKLVQWLAARFERRSGNWYCFFHISDLTGEDRPQAPRPVNRPRVASRPRQRVAAPPGR